MSRGESPSQDEAQINLSKVTFRVPDRSTLPEISRYAHLRLGDGATRIVGFVEGRRGCKHLCRHCPVVPVYKGKFRVVPADVVMGDIRQQVGAVPPVPHTGLAHALNRAGFAGGSNS